MNIEAAPTPTITFRAADSRDIPALVALVTSAYRGDDSRAGWTTEADLLDGMRIDGERIQADLDRDRSRVIIAARVPNRAEDPGDMLACAHVMEEDGAGYFGMFAVRPDLQGAGLGKSMLAEAERIAREDWSLPAMRMTVIDVRDELIAFYERRGYRRTGIRKPFPYGDARYGLPKRDGLRFEILEKVL